MLLVVVQADKISRIGASCQDLEAGLKIARKLHPHEDGFTWDEVEESKVFYSSCQRKH